jgi:hypothetical protein
VVLLIYLQQYQHLQEDSSCCTSGTQFATLDLYMVSSDSLAMPRAYSARFDIRGNRLVALFM